MGSNSTFDMGSNSTFDMGSNSSAAILNSVQDSMEGNSSNDNSTYLHMLHINETINCVFISLCMPFILIGNILVIVSVLKFRQLRTVMNTFVANLAIADLLVGFPTIPLYIWFFADNTVKTMQYPCLLKYVFVLISMPCSALNLLLVTIDRFIAIVYPLQYPVWMTKTRAKIMIAIIWVYAIGTATLPLYGINNWRPGGGCDFWLVLPRAYTIPVMPVMQCIALGATFVLYLKIFHEAKMNKKRIDSFKRKGNFDEKKMKRDTRNAQVMALVFCMFLVFWMPLFTSAVLKYIQMPGSTMEMIKQWAVSLAMSNSLVNPIIYCWIRRDFRTAFKTLTCFRVPITAMESLFGASSAEMTISRQVSSVAECETVITEMDL